MLALIWLMFSSKNINSLHLLFPMLFRGVLKCLNGVPWPYYTQRNRKKYCLAHDGKILEQIQNAVSPQKSVLQHQTSDKTNWSIAS